jgi:Cof subfamily protein (haloacid dehalogenase superfamily)
MKIAASDYDGTLFRQGTIDAETVAAVKVWRKAGNKFGVISGRDYGMLVPQLRYYGIDFDFAVCNNGGIIWDEKGEVICQRRIAAELLTSLMQEEKAEATLHFAFSAADCTYICQEKAGSWISREAKAWKFPLREIDEKDVGKLKDIQQLSLGFSSSAQAAACAEDMNRDYGDMIHAYPNRGSLDITPAGVSKSQGLEDLLRLSGYGEPQLFVIGDEVNDLSMITAFGGYTVDTARAAIKQQARGSFKSVGSMLEHFL